MKRLLTIFVISVLAILSFSCKKEKIQNKEEINYAIDKIQVTEEYQIYAEAEEGSIPVTVSPWEATLKKHAVISCDPEGVISFTAEEDAIKVKPLKVGETTLTIKPRYGDGASAECVVKVVNDPSLPASVSIVRDDHFVNGRLEMAANETYQVKTVVKNAAGEVTTGYKVWVNLLPYSSSGDIVIENDGDGVIKATSPSGLGEAEGYLTVHVDGYPKINDHAMADFLPIPSKIIVNFTGKYTLNSDKELIIKKGATAPFTIATEPENAIKHLTASSRLSAKAAVTLNGESGSVTAGASSGAAPVTITFSSPYNNAITQNYSVYVVDYDADDVKEGDWVYSDASRCQSVDCGLRLTGSSPMYVNEQGKRSTTPRTHPGETLSSRSYKYIGVIVSTVLPQDNDFMKLSLLKQCKSGSSAKGLYEYNFFRKSNLCGLTNSTSTHALVVKRNEVIEQKWQTKTCEVAGQSDNQLSRQNPPYFTFSPEQAEYWTDYYKDDENNPNHHEYTHNEYEGGLLSHLLMRYYSQKQSEYQVIPVMCINNMATFQDVLKISDGISTSGWFLPADYEFTKFGLSASIVNASLNASNAAAPDATLHADGALSGNYWTTLEPGLNHVIKYTVSGNTVTRSEVEKGVSGGAYTRAFLYL